MTTNDGIYNKEERAEQLEDDEITSEEAGFMEGYEDIKLVLCENCETKVHSESEFELQFKKKKHRFCSNNCALDWQENQRD